MTGALDAEMRDLAVELTEEFGKPITITRETGSSYDPSTGTTSPTYTDYSANSAPPSSFEYRNIDGSLIQTGDLVIGVPAKGLNIEPSTADTVKLDGTVYQVVQVRPQWSGEKVALYEMQLRGA